SYSQWVIERRTLYDERSEHARYFTESQPGRAQTLTSQRGSRSLTSPLPLSGLSCPPPTRRRNRRSGFRRSTHAVRPRTKTPRTGHTTPATDPTHRSEEHMSELQSRF